MLSEGLSGYDGGGGDGGDDDGDDWLPLDWTLGVRWRTVP